MTLLKSRASDCAERDSVNKFEEQNHVAKPGDLVIIQEKYTNLTPVTLKQDAHVDNRYGKFAHNDILGKSLGRRWEAKTHPGPKSGSQQCAGFVHALAPTPELWSLALSHRTQIVYAHDTAVIAFYLELKPGMTLIECGTGSASATTAFARIIAPNGLVRSFEFHHQRAEAARKDLNGLGLESVTEINGGIDITKQGFIGVKNGEADAVFLDVPAPYLLGAELKRVLHENGSVCLFSPCLEQVQKSCEMLRREGFHSIRTVTATVRTYETREQILDLPGFEDLTEKEEDSTHNEEPARKRVRTTRTDETEINDVDKFKTVEKTKNGKSRTARAERLAVSALDGRHEGRILRAKVRLHSRPFSHMKGHTSYLTFGRRGRDMSMIESENVDMKKTNACLLN